MSAKTTVGFLLAPSNSWLGGANYFSNLIKAVSTHCGSDIDTVCFFGHKVEERYVSQIAQGTRVVRTSLLDRKSLLWFLWKVTRLLTGGDWFVQLCLWRHGIKVFSHSNLRQGLMFKACNWIPDLQHVVLPQFFSSAELDSRSRSIADMAKHSSLIFFSSNAALQDFHAHFKNNVQTCVLRFVSSPPARTEVEFETLVNLYDLKSGFLYLPNQFWQHKNHGVVFKAVSILAQRGIDVQLVCTGNMDDYRNPDYKERLFSQLRELNIERQVKLLGIVPYEHVFGLIQHSSAVLNPSLFEGWSSTVEECKSCNKAMLLSDIAVHREQTDQAIFFDPHNAEDLAQKIEDFIAIGPDSVSCVYPDSSDRMQAFAQVFRDAILNVK